MGGRRPWQIARGVVAALVLGTGLTVNNARAALQGFRRARGEWERTPKTGDRMSQPVAVHRAAVAGSGHAEVALAGYCAGLALLAEISGHERALPFILLLALAFCSVGWASRRIVAARG